MDTSKRMEYIPTRRDQMSEGKVRRRYDRAFKEGAVRLVVEEGQTLAGTARDLGITETMLTRWRKEYLADQGQAFPGKGRVKPGAGGKPERLLCPSQEASKRSGA